MSIHIVRVSLAVMKKLSGVQSTESIESIALMKIPPSFNKVDISQYGADCKTWFPFPHQNLVVNGIQGGVFLLPEFQAVAIPSMRKHSVPAEVLLFSCVYSFRLLE